LASATASVAASIRPCARPLALVHIVYFLLVGRLYRNADLSVAYPIMRGLAPLIAALIALATLGEAPGPVAVLGIVILVFGVMLMGVRRADLARRIRHCGNPLCECRDGLLEPNKLVQ
jgi:multidrug transporter EmrE-like cation transporter